MTPRSTPRNSVPVASACCPGNARAHPRPTRGYAALFKALGDETRLEMLGLLAAARGELCACEIEARFELSQPTVSHHLRVLREAGLLRAVRRGTWIYYALEPAALAQLGSFQELLQTKRGA